jgi:hypothetical protein
MVGILLLLSGLVRIIVQGRVDNKDGSVAAEGLCGAGVWDRDNASGVGVVDGWANGSEGDGGSGVFLTGT